METNERFTLVTDCPQCGSPLEHSEFHNKYFLDYVCPVCGLKWQVCMVPKSSTDPRAARTWMQRLAQD
jgi:rRNA maturation protein Nop10